MAYNPNMRKAVPGYPGWEADSDGKVYRDGIEVRGYLNGGYIYINSRLKRSWLVALAFHGMWPDNMNVLHINDVKSDDRPVNLRYGTQSDNMADMYRNGGYRSMVEARAAIQFHGSADHQGSANPNVKLHEIDVIAMRDDYASGDFTQHQLANMYGISQNAVSRIVNRKAWSHV